MMDEVERDLEVMGVTAIEDKLQDGVPETLKGLREAGVKVSLPPPRGRRCCVCFCIAWYGADLHGAAVLALVPRCGC
jgi:hypothetical protein